MIPGLRLITALPEVIEIEVINEESTMKTMTLQTTIGPNGTIHLDISSDLPPGPAKVELTIQPIDPRSRLSLGRGIQRTGVGPST